ncbi:MAG: glutaredoxin family protein [Rhodoglobus sp.]
MTTVRLTLISKPECHLCDTARQVVAAVLRDCDDPELISVDEVSILEDAELNEKYWDEIPVLMINGVVHTIWRVEPDRLLAALREATA